MIHQALITLQMVIEQNQMVNILWFYVVDYLFKSKVTFSQFCLNNFTDKANAELGIADQIVPNLVTEGI